MVAVDGLGNLHSQVCCSVSSHILPLLLLVPYNKGGQSMQKEEGQLGWANFWPKLCFYAISLCWAAQHLVHTWLSPPALLSHMSYLFRKVTCFHTFYKPGLIPSFPFKDQLCLWWPPSCISTKELKITPNQDILHYCISKPSAGGLAFWWAYSTLMLPQQACTG